MLVGGALANSLLTYWGSYVYLGSTTLAAVDLVGTLTVEEMLKHATLEGRTLLAIYNPRDLGLREIPNNTIPEAVGECTALQAIYLSSVSGPLPSSLRLLTSLQSLNLYNVHGPVDISAIAHLSNLFSLALSYVSGGTTGRLEGCENLQKLQSIDLTHAGLTSALPMCLFGLPGLKTLSASACRFDGNFPEQLPVCIEKLSVASSNLTGSIPAGIGKYALLAFLDLSRNALVGTLPSELGLLSSLSELVLSGNSFSGTVPTELGQFGQLRKLDLAGNLLEGTLPCQLGALTRLRELLVSANRLRGALPQQLAALTGLVVLSLDSNSFRGGVDHLCSSLLVVNFVNTSYNQLSGTVPHSGHGSVWTAHCDYSGLSWETCRRHIDPCLRDQGFYLFARGDPGNGDGRLCLASRMFLVAPLGTVFAFALAFLLWATRKGLGGLTCSKALWCLLLALIAATDIGSSWTTALAGLDAPAEYAGPCLACVCLVLLFGFIGALLCPAFGCMQAPDLVLVVASPQLLFAVPFLAALRYNPRGRGEEGVGGEAGVGGEGGEGEPGFRQGHGVGRFMRRVSAAKVIANVVFVVLQALLLGASHHSLLARVALGLGVSNLVASLLVVARVRFATTPHPRVRVGA